MRLVQVVGYKKSGKTSLINRLIERLKSEGKTAVVIKHTHNMPDIQGANDSSEFIDTGASQAVVAHGDYIYTQETDPGLPKIIKRFLVTDYLFIEGYKDVQLPRIVCSRDGEISEQLGKGMIASVTVGQTEQSQVVDDLLSALSGLSEYPPGLDCGKCGYSCMEEYARENRGEDICCRMEPEGFVRVSSGGMQIKTAPFVEKIIADMVTAVVKNLKGYREGEIKVIISKKGGDDDK